MAARKTTKTAKVQDADRATLEAFYMRVMHRVCRSYRERSGNGDAAALLEQQWTEHLACYTGGLGDFPVGEGGDLDLVDPSFASLDRELDALLPDAFEPAVEGLTAQIGSPGVGQGAPLIGSPVPAGQPFSHMRHDSLATPSVFSKMLGAKRAFSQLDGPADDLDAASADLFPDMPDPRRRRVVQAPVSLPRDATVSDGWDNQQISSSDFGASSSVTMGSLEPTSELLPVSALSVNQFPLQLSAYYSKFGYRSKLQGYAGEVHAAILTMPVPVDRPAAVAPGHFLWRPSSDAADVEGMVEVVSRDDEHRSVRVRTTSGREEVMPIESAFRLKECIIPKGTVCFQE